MCTALFNIITEYSYASQTPLNVKCKEIRYFWNFQWSQHIDDNECEMENEYMRANERALIDCLGKMDGMEMFF